jgi:hypothetical protein
MLKNRFDFDIKMDVQNFNELWKRIPPEEKLLLNSAANSFGVIIAFFLFLMLSALAIGYKEPLLLWGGLALTPLVFQLASSRDWRKRRSHTVLEYLAARSAVRRFAYNLCCLDLEVQLLFKGALKKVTSIEASDLDSPPTGDEKDPFSGYQPVWIAFFRDGIVIVSESIGGAQVEFMHLINDKLYLKVEEVVISGRAFKVLEFKSSERRASKGETYRIISLNMPAAINALEQKLNIAMLPFNKNKIIIE